jgi:surfactin synthase thioesterase subunit
MTTMPPMECWWWFRPYRPSQPTVLYFPGAGSDHSGEVHLAPHMEGVNFGVWRMPGRGARAGEPHPDNMRSLASDIASAVVGLGCSVPVLSGHSFGGLLGYTVCQELESRGFTVGRFVPVTSSHPFLWRIDSYYAKIRGGAWKHAQRRLAVFEKSGVWPPEKVENEAILQEARFRTWVDGALGLQPIPRTRIKASITDVTAKDDEILTKLTPPRRWAKYTVGDFESILVEGGHFFYWRRPKVLATILKNEAEMASSGLSH